MFPIGDSVKSRRFPFFNIFFIAVTIYVFFLQITSQDQDSMIYAYSLIPETVDFADSYTLIPFFTSMFLHGGFLHIISNMMFLYVFGDNVEGELPFLFYPFLYIGSGIAGGFMQYLIMPSSSIPMLGASGAVAGALGGYFAMFPNHKIKTLIPVLGFPSVIEVSAKFMLGYWIVIQIFSGFMSFPVSDQGGVAFFAHIGGFVFGFIFAKILRRDREV